MWVSGVIPGVVPQGALRLLPLLFSLVPVLCGAQTWGAVLPAGSLHQEPCFLIKSESEPFTSSRTDQELFR